MRVETHDNLRNPTNTTATRVVVYNDNDDPIAVVVQIEGNRYVAATIHNEKFGQILEAMGIKNTAVVHRVDLSKLPPLKV